MVPRIRPCTKSDRGAALLEAAFTIPLLLLVGAGIFEFGRAYATWQVMTNAAREGARLAVSPTRAQEAVQARVTEYMYEELPYMEPPSVSVTNVTISIGATTASASKVTVNCPFEFFVFQPLARLVAPSSRLGEPLTLTASAVMRNESP